MAFGVDVSFDVGIGIGVDDVLLSYKRFTPFYQIRTH
jgi:hypothetical protein